MLLRIDKSRYRITVNDEMTGSDFFGCGAVVASGWEPRSYEIYDIAVDIVDEDGMKVRNAC